MLKKVFLSQKWALLSLLLLTQLLNTRRAEFTAVNH
ncbi:unnamed protein product [Linum tenue]|uniref:Uncharacterized protein n=1 Tax=Linum tenue TaxID=586396 RepID=A0AAV0NTY8_9ROSI|nr:unnamed protein product [Linum tenue]